MASKEDLIIQAGALASELEKDTPVTEGLNHAALTALVKGLKAEKASREESNDLEDEESNDLEDEESNDLEDEPGYYVAAGKAITSLRGIRGPGVQVEAKYFPGGQETLDGLVKRGDVVKK